jgi:hypothetical protein
MDSTEAQLRFGVSLSSSHTDELSVSATQYLRHLEERALLTNYFNSSSNAASNTSSHVNYAIGTGPFLSSRFGSGIDARRKLTIMQHQHQQFQNMHTSTHQPSSNGSQSTVPNSVASTNSTATGNNNSAAQFYQQALSAAVSAVNSTILSRTARKSK